MRLLLIFAVFGFAIAEPVPYFEVNSVYNEYETEVRALEKEVNKSIECVREILKKGLPQLGLPSFDPLKVQNITVDLNKLGVGKNLTGKISVNNLLVNGITSWHTKYLKGKLGVIPPSYQLQAEVTIARVFGNGDYSGNVTIFQKNVYGNGSVQAEVQNINVKLNVKLKLNKKKFIFENFSLVVGVRSINATVTGFMNNPQASKNLSKWLSEELPKLIQQNPGWIDKNLSEKIKQVLNQGLQNPQQGGIVDHIIKKCSPF